MVLVDLVLEMACRATLVVPVLVRPWVHVLVNLVLVLTLGLWPVGHVVMELVLALASQ